ncbi:MAG: phosphoglycerate dehydrogenase [Anaerolineales bacterium]|jgi:D-3-phosphoglycerate dehydrogenase
MARVLAASLSFCKLSLQEEPGDKLRAAGIQIDVNSKGQQFTETELLSLIEGYDGIIVGADPMTAAVINKGTNLKIIAKNGVGYDNIDLKAATERHIYVTYTPGAVERTVADSTFALILVLARNIHKGDASIRRGQWERIIGSDVWHKKLGILGLGRIGKNVVRRSKGFEMEVYACDPAADAAFCEQNGVHLVDLETLFKTCDIVTLHAPLDETTRHIVNDGTLALMKPDALLINTSRGDLVDEQALYRALKEKRIAGAAIDVFSKEPPPKDFPLLELANVVLTPHMAGYSRDALLFSGDMIAESIIAAFRGEVPPNVVNKERIGQ